MEKTVETTDENPTSAEEAQAKYVSCEEVQTYLKELSNVMTQIAFGINESIETMKERVNRKGDTNNDDKD
jgi:hypothetical protein